MKKVAYDGRTENGRSGGYHDTYSWARMQKKRVQKDRIRRKLAKQNNRR